MTVNATLSVLDPADVLRAGAVRRLGVTAIRFSTLREGGVVTIECGDRDELLRAMLTAVMEVCAAHAHSDPPLKRMLDAVRAALAALRGDDVGGLR